jgi:hypothetical protein
MTIFIEKKPAGDGGPKIQTAGDMTGGLEGEDLFGGLNRWASIPRVLRVPSSLN